jgi:hypothetical protein
MQKIELVTFLLSHIIQINYKYSLKLALNHSLKPQANIKALLTYLQLSTKISRVDQVGDKGNFVGLAEVSLKRLKLQIEGY